MASTAVPAGTLTVSGSIMRPAPRVLGYNLGHYYPGSNMTGWWKYSGVTGARVFLSASHFAVRAAEVPGDALVVDKASFLARREALRHNPLDPDIINWESIEDRFNTVLNSNNEIVPQYALEELHRLGTDILAQMTVSEGSFPIASEADWQGKWTLWKTYYAAAFWMARAFDVERYTSHNEPNHPNSRIEPDPWLMRARLASDAASEAINAVNKLYGKSLQLNFMAPVTAGGSLSTLAEYGETAIAGIRTNFSGEAASDYRLLHTYAYQQYNTSPDGQALRYRTLREAVDALTPQGVEQLSFAITEFNVHTNANFDEMVESSDTLSKAVRFGGIVVELAKAGMDELYAFKFAMTAAGGNFPVAKNGMGFIDNDNAPFNYGSLGRSGEVYRLFNKAVRPGRDILTTASTDLPASSYALACRDPATGNVWLFLVNEGASSVPLTVDLSDLNLPDGQSVLIEDVSAWRKGIVRSRETIVAGKIAPGSQPGESVWLVSIPGSPILSLAEGGATRVLPVIEDSMVRDGTFAETNFGTARDAWTQSGANSVNERAAVLLKFPSVVRSDRTRLEQALLALPVASMAEGPPAEAHLYGLTNVTWDETSVTWNNAPNLKKGIPAGNEIRHSAIDGHGLNAQILAQVTAGSSPIVRYIDVTAYLDSIADGYPSFILIQEPRWNVDIAVTQVPASPDDLPRGDTQPGGMRTFPKEGIEALSGAALILYESVTPESYLQWSQRSIPSPDKRDPEVSADNDGIPNLLKFATGHGPSALPRILRQPDGTLALTFSRSPSATGISLQMARSTALPNWVPMVTDSRTHATFDGTYLQFALPLTPSTDPEFFRLEASLD